MEQRMKICHSRRGVALVTVLFITGIGLLFGAGALLIFRYQCQLRVDRQHEISKMYSVRSALNYIRTNTTTIDAEFPYYAHERRFGVVIKPAAQIFPLQGVVFDNPVGEHFLIEKQNNSFPSLSGGEYCDYEYGAEGVTNLQIKIESYRNDWCLSFGRPDTTNVVKRWVNIGMRDTGGWLEEEYGRRYFFTLSDFGSSSSTTDVIRLCIVRNVTNNFDQAGNEVEKGHRRGWPLSRENYERAIVFQIRPRAGNSVNNAEMTVCEYWREFGVTYTTNLMRVTSFPTRYRMGMQLADDTVSLFYIDNNGNVSIQAPGYTFSDSVKLSRSTYQYFKDGIVTNETGVHAPELRAVFEVESPKGDYVYDKSDYITKFRVTPAYQYDVSIVRPDLVYKNPVTGIFSYDLVTNLATVAQKTGSFTPLGTSYSLLTYDTHGTENKGFRKDEREAARRQQGQ